MVERLLLIFTGLFTLLYLWLKYIYSYWSRRGVPQPPTFPFCGHVLDNLLNRKSLGEVIDDIYRSHPENEAVGVYALLTPKLLLRSPRLFKKVMVSDFSSFHDNEFYVLKTLDPHYAEDPFIVRGEEWKQSRAMLATSVTTGKVKELLPLMRDSIDRLEAFLKENDGKEVDAKEMSILFTMDNVSNCVFGISSNCFTDPQAAFRKMSDLIMKDNLQSTWKMMIMNLMPNVRDMLGLRFVPKSASDYVENLMQEVNDHRVKNNTIRKDLFQHFMKKAKESEDPLHAMHALGMTFFIEGFETAAMIASATLYELAVNPEVQHTLYEELRAALPVKFEIDYDTINNLPYLEKTVQETLRKYPVMFSYTRLCTRQTNLEIDGKILKIEEGTPVIIPVFSIHSDPRFYPDPERFDPERFNEENKSSRPPCTYVPFGEGPRLCPGSKFGIAQVKLVVAKVIYSYKVLKTPKTPEKLTYAPNTFFAVPNVQQWVKVVSRNHT